MSKMLFPLFYQVLKVLISLGLQTVKLYGQFLLIGDSPPTIVTASRPKEEGESFLERNIFEKTAEKRIDHREFVMVDRSNFIGGGGNGDPFWHTKNFLWNLSSHFVQETCWVLDNECLVHVHRIIFEKMRVGLHIA